MKYILDDKEYNVEIVRKNNRNTYVRVKDDLTIYVTTSIFTTEKQILKLLQDTCRKEKMTVIIITHNSAIAPMADKVIHFKNGKSEDIVINERPKSIDEIEW